MNHGIILLHAGSSDEQEKGFDTPLLLLLLLHKWDVRIKGVS